jgi:hypothetical protein
MADNCCEKYTIETARPARLGRVSYGVVNLYLTFLDDLFEVYLIGIQVDVERIGETRFPCSLDT